MSRRPVNPTRRFGETGGAPLSGSLHQKARPSPLLIIGLILLGTFLLIAYSYHGTGGFSSEKEALNKVEETCTVVSLLLKEEDTEAWGVEPYDIEDADRSCKSLIRKGIVRVADIKFPLPYKPKSFSVVIVSDALDYLSPRYLNKTLPDLVRVSRDGLVIFAGYPGQQRAKTAEFSKFGRPAKLRSSSWWIKYFVQNRLEENEVASKKFEQTASKRSYKPSCQVFHLSPSP
ncbi:hypothetical protein AAC387_Pa03g4127 [Persea americana]